MAGISNKMDENTRLKDIFHQPEGRKKGRKAKIGMAGGCGKKI